MTYNILYTLLLTGERSIVVLWPLMLFLSDGSLPWHRVHAVNPEGPVGKNGVVQPGDHLVEVSGVMFLEGGGVGTYVPCLNFKYVSCFEK